MKLISCYHPKMVKNPYTGETVVTRCGKCPACLNARAASWVQRLDNESLQNKFTLFGTFTYDEKHVKQLVRLRDEDNLDTLPVYIDSLTGQTFSLSDCPDVTSADIQYCNETKILCVFDVSDWQKFIKRLRKFIYTHYGKTTKFRYYCAFEFGPQSFRPHSHSLFFTDSAPLAENFHEICSRMWQNGNVFDVHIVTGSASNYVAQYVNSFASLPKIYLHPNIRQKAVFSKCPPIGLKKFTKETLKQLFNKNACTFTLFRKDVSKFCDVPLWRSLQNRLYPRITAFDRLSDSDRITLYRLGLSPYTRNRDYKYLINWFKRPYWREYYEYAFKSLGYDNRYRFNLDSLSRFVSTVVRVCDNAIDFGVTISFYVNQIANFYEKQESTEFLEYLKMQDDYFKCHPASDFLLMNANFYIMTKGKYYDDLQDWQKFYLSIYAPYYKSGDKIDYSYKDCFAYNDLVMMHNKIYFDNVKQKKSNDYILSKKDKFNNIINYNKNIENYESFEII